MEHEEIKNKLFAYLDNELSNKEKMIIRDHLDKCNECSEYFIKIKKLLSGINKVQKTEELPSDSYFETLSNVIMQQLPYSPDSKWKKYFSFLFKKELSAVAVMTIVLIFVVTFRYFISDSFIPSQEDKDEIVKVEYHTYLPPESLNRSVQISTVEDITISEEESSFSITTEQPVASFPSQEGTDKIQDISSGEIRDSEIDLSVVGGGEIAETTGGVGAIFSESSVTMARGGSCLSDEGVVDNINESNYFQVEEEINYDRTEEIQTRETLLVSQRFRNNFGYFKEVNDSVDEIIVQLSLDENGNVYKINFSKGKLSEEDSNIIISNFIGRNYISSDSLITVNLFKMKKTDSLP